MQIVSTGLLTKLLLWGQRNDNNVLMSSGERNKGDEMTSGVHQDDDVWINSTEKFKIIPFGQDKAVLKCVLKRLHCQRKILVYQEIVRAKSMYYFVVLMVSIL